MLPYIFVFIINIFLTLLIDKSWGKNQFVVISSLILLGLVFTIFVGCRDFGVGYDTNVYINTYFNKATLIKNIKDFTNEQDVDFGFLFLAWVSNLISSDSQSLLVITELWIIVFTLFGLYFYRKKYKIKFSTFFMLYWLLLFFQSMNFMRQYCSMSLLFFGFALYLLGHKKVYLILQIIAYFFHSTSLVFIIVPIFYYLSSIDMPKRKYLSMLMICGIVICAVSYFYILHFLGNVGTLSEIYTDRYSETNTGSYKDGYTVGPVLVLSILIQVILYFEVKKKRLLPDIITYMFIMTFSTVFVINQLNAINVNLSRISLYINQVCIIYLSLLLNVSRNRKVVLIKGLLLLIMLRSCINSSFNVDYEPQDFSYSSKILNIK